MIDPTTRRPTPAWPPARRIRRAAIAAIAAIALGTAGCSATGGPAGTIDAAPVEEAVEVDPADLDAVADPPSATPAPAAAAPAATAVAAPVPDGTPVPGAGRWQPLPPSPLAPRDAPGIAWTGREVLVIGGHDRPPCVPGGGCDPVNRISTSLRDGAAYDPATGTWRPIAEVPMSLRDHRAVGLRGGAIVGRPDGPLWRYTAVTDSWRRLRSAPRGLSELAVSGDRAVAYAPSHEALTPVDHRYDPFEDVWYSLPTDPLGLSEDRRMVWVGDQLVLFGTSLDPEHRGDPPVVRAAILDDPGGEDADWTLVPGDGGPAGMPAWIDGGDGQLVAADPLGGGVLRLDPPGWYDLPAPSAALQATGTTIGVAPGGDDRTAVAGGWALDITTGRWARLPGHPLLPERDHESVWAGDRLVVWGGGAVDGDGTWQPSAAGLSWQPPWAGLDRGSGPTLAPVADVEATAVERPGPGGRPDGRIDCPDESRIRLTALFDEDPPGLSTPGRALRAYLQRQADHDGGAVVILDRLHASVLVDDRETLAATARRLPTGRWVAGLLTACGDVDLIIE